MMSILQQIKELVVCLLAAILFVVFCVGILVCIPIAITLGQIHLLGQTHDEFQRFDLPNGRSVVIFCEHEWFYEPPGYIYYDVVEKENILVSKRAFQGVGPERTPSEKFKIVSSDDGNLVAIVFASNVVIMHDFRTNRSWPTDRFQRDDWKDYLLAKDLITEFNVEEKKLYCDAVERYPQKHLPSADLKRFVRHEWVVNEDLKGCQLKVRMSDQKGQDVSLFEVNFPAADLLQRLHNDQWKVTNAQWKAGWLDVDTFAVSNDKVGTRVWQFKPDGVCVELPKPTTSQYKEQIKSLQTSPWKASPNLDFLKTIREMQQKRKKG